MRVLEGLVSEQALMDKIETIPEELSLV